MVGKWLFLTGSVDKFGPSVFSRQAESKARKPNEAWWTCSHPSTQRRRRSDVLSPPSRELSASKTWTGRLSFWINLFLFLKLRGYNCSVKKEIILFFPVQGRCLESPGWCRGAGGTNRESTYFTAVDVHSFWSFSEQTTNRCEDVPNTRLGQHNNVSFLTFNLTQPTRLHLICLAIFCVDSWKSFPLYLVFCYIPAQSKVAAILRSEAEHSTECRETSMKKMNRELAETPAMALGKELWIIGRWDERELSGFISKEDGIVLLSSVCPIPQKNLKRWRVCASFSALTKSSHCFMQSYLHRNGQRKGIKRFKLQLKSSESRTIYQLQKLDLGSQIYPILTGPEPVYLFPISECVKIQMRWWKMRKESLVQVSWLQEVRSAFQRQLHWRGGGGWMLLLGYGPQVKMLHPLWCHRHTFCWEAENKEEKSIKPTKVTSLNKINSGVPLGELVPLLTGKRTVWVHSNVHIYLCCSLPIISDQSRLKKAE